MRLCNLTYEEALAKHPEEVSRVIKDLRSSRSKHRLAAPETLVWSYQTCVECESFSFRDLVEGKVSPRKVLNTAEELAQDQTNRTLTSLCAEIGRMCVGERVPNPPEVYIQALKSWKNLKERSALGFA